MNRTRPIPTAWFVIVFVAVLSCFGVFLVPGCFNSSDKPAAQAKADSIAAAQTKADYRAKWQAFKHDVEETIALNGRRIDTLRHQASKVSKKTSVKIGKDIDVLEEKNKALDKKLSSYEDKGESAWESFEREFSHDMSELGKALKDLTVDNVK